MKKETLLIITLIFVVLLTFPGMARRLPEINANVLKYSPNPATQGSTVKIWLKIDNAGTTADNIEVKFIPEYPFSLPAGEPITKKIGVIPGTEEAVVDFTALVDLYAPNEEIDIKFQYRWTENEVWTELTYPISVETTDALIVISNYSITPSPVIPGTEAEMKINIKNAGIMGIKNADIILDTTEVDFFTTLDTGTIKRIDYLEPGEAKEVKFKIMTDADAELKVYNIPINIKFKDDKNNDYATSIKIGMKVNKNPNIIMFIDSSEITNKGTPGKIRVKTVNKGVDIKYATLKIIKTPEYEILSPSNIAYIGNLDGDDFDTTEFLIKALKNDPLLQFTLEFKDSYSKDFMQAHSLPLKIVSKSELGEGGSSWPVIILLLAIIGVAYWLIKKRIKKNKKTNKK